MKCMLHVYHQGADKPVGKVFPHPATGVLIFLHEESGTQAHQNLAAPGGIDTCIIPDLVKWKVAEVHHYNRATKTLFTVGLREFCEQSKVRTMGGRKRAYLSEWNWWRHPHGMTYKPVWCKDIVRYGGPLEGLQLGLPGLEGAGGQAGTPPEDRGAEGAQV